MAFLHTVWHILTVPARSRQPGQSWPRSRGRRCAASTTFHHCLSRQGRGSVCQNGTNTWPGSSACKGGRRRLGSCRGAGRRLEDDRWHAPFLSIAKIDTFTWCETDLTFEVRTETELSGFDSLQLQCSHFAVANANGEMPLWDQPISMKIFICPKRLNISVQI